MKSLNGEVEVQGRLYQFWIISAVENSLLIKLKNSFLPLSNKYNAFAISAFIVVCDSDLSLQFTHMIVNPADAQFTNDQRVRH